MIRPSPPAQNDVGIGALEGKAADACAGAPSRMRCPARLAGHVRLESCAERADHMRINLCQMKDV